MANSRRKSIIFMILGAILLVFFLLLFIPTNSVEGVVDVKSYTTTKVYVVSGYRFFNDIMDLAYSYNTAQHAYYTQSIEVELERRKNIEPFVKERRDSLFVQLNITLKNNSSVQEILPDQNGYYSVSKAFGNHFVFALADFQILGLKSYYLVGFQKARCDITDRI